MNEKELFKRSINALGLMILEMSVWFGLATVVKTLVYRLPIEGIVGDLIKSAIFLETLLYSSYLLVGAMDRASPLGEGYWKRFGKNLIKETSMIKWILFTFLVAFFVNILLIFMISVAFVCIIYILRIPTESVWMLVWMLVFVSLIVVMTYKADVSLAKMVQKKIEKKSTNKPQT